MKREKSTNTRNLPAKQPSQLDDLVTLASTIKRDSVGIALADRLNASQPVKSPADFGLIVKNARKAKGLSQQQFADLAGVGRRFVSECEAGKPRLEFAKVLQVAAAAGIDVFAAKR